MTPPASSSSAKDAAVSTSALPTPPVQVQLGTRTALQLLRKARL